MRRSIPPLLFQMSLGILLQHGIAFSQKSTVGLFEAHGDVGSVHKSGSVDYRPSSGEYLVAGGGENMWFRNDACHFVFLSYEKGVKGHPENKDVMLRLMPAEGGEVQVLAKLFGDRARSMYHPGPRTGRV